MRAEKGLRGVHVLWMVLGFFALIIGADTFFIIRAVNTFPGEQVRNSYVLGLDFNREIEKRDRQAELGWTAEAGIVDSGKTEFVVRVADRTQSPVTGLRVEASYFLAGGGRLEHKFTLNEGVPGEYRAFLDDDHAGRAEFRIVAQRSDDTDTLFSASKVAVIP